MSPDEDIDWSKHDVVVISPQYWGDYWVSKHWIANEFSKLTRTFFVEPPIWVGGMLRSPFKNMDHWRRFLLPTYRIKQNLTCVSSSVLPSFIERFTGGANERLLSRLVRFGLRKPIVLNFGTNIDLVKGLAGEVTAYYCVDPVFPERGQEDDEKTVCEISDCIIAVSDRYKESLAAYGTGTPVEVIPHGYNFEASRSIDEDSSECLPEDLRNLPKPILGFVGSIHDAYVDIELVESVATHRPDASIVLIGPYKNNPLGPDLSESALYRLSSLKNVHLIGPRHFLDVPRYVKHFDVCLILVNEKNQPGGHEVPKRTHFKWLIYLSMGKPIVAPDVFEARSIEDLVYLCESESVYLAAVDKAAGEDGSKRRDRIEYASRFSFAEIMKRIKGELSKYLGS